MRQNSIPAPILIVKTGSALPGARQDGRDFEHWFEDALGHAGGIHTLRIDDPAGDAAALPTVSAARSRYAGVVITGSPAMVSHQADWSERAAGWAAEVATSGLPLLGVCFGHQLLAHGLGGRVGANPRGRQMGTQPISLLTAAREDALLGHLPPQFSAQTSHQESVLELPPGAVLLATSPRDDLHAYRWGRAAWGVQFHPEWSTGIMDAYIEARRGALLKEQQDPEALKTAITPTREAASVLRRFATLTRKQS